MRISIVLLLCMAALQSGASAKEYGEGMLGMDVHTNHGSEFSLERKTKKLAHQNFVQSVVQTRSKKQRKRMKRRNDKPGARAAVSTGQVAWDVNAQPEQKRMKKWKRYPRDASTGQATPVVDAHAEQHEKNLKELSVHRKLHSMSLKRKRKQRKRTKRRNMQGARATSTNQASLPVDAHTKKQEKSLNDLKDHRKLHSISLRKTKRKQRHRMKRMTMNARGINTSQKMLGLRAHAVDHDWNQKVNNAAPFGRKLQFDDINKVNARTQRNLRMFTMRRRQRNRQMRMNRTAARVRGRRRRGMRKRRQNRRRGFRQIMRAANRGRMQMMRGRRFRQVMRGRNQGPNRRGFRGPTGPGPTPATPGTPTATPGTPTATPGTPTTTPATGGGNTPFPTAAVNGGTSAPTIVAATTAPTITGA